jgi:hypothetical protein
MRKRIFVIAAAALLAGASAAMAQSGQGGYLGLNPGGHLTTPTHARPPEHGSGQGGYLGRNPGAHLATPTQPPPAEFGSGEGGYLGMIPGEPSGANIAGSTTPTANQLSRARVAR